MSLPVIGAALDTKGLEAHIDWILEKDRDLELQAFHTPEVLDGDWRAEADHSRKLLNGYAGRLGIHGPFWGFSIAAPDREIQKLVARRMDQGLDICEAVGATQMVIHSPYTTWDHNNLDNVPGQRAKVIEAAHASIGAAVKRAEDQGVTLVLENIQDVDPNERLRLIQTFDSPALRLSIDTGHAHYAATSTGAPPVDYFVAAAGDMLDHVHLQDADGYADRHWRIGDGTILWPQVFRALAAVGSNPRLVLELRDKAAVPASMRYLEEMGLGQ